MRAGHIALDGKEYMIELSHYQRALANPFAAKLGSGPGTTAIWTIGRRG